jgi:kynurenine formamidase
MPDVHTVRELAARLSNWGRWGEDDQRGTLNLLTDERVRAAARCIRSGRRFSLALPFDEHGPQSGLGGRFNPIHLMIRDGGDIATNSIVADFYGGLDRHIRSTDDVIIMPLQSGTQWDALAHVFFDGAMYNGHPPSAVSSRGATRNDVTNGSDRLAGRGVLLDVARHHGLPELPPGHAIDGAQLAACAAAQQVAIRPGDCLLIRTGQLGRCRGTWQGFAGGEAPGLGLGSVAWLHEHDIAAIATDTWAMEVQPCETPDVYLPLHIVLISRLGLWVGEIFDLDALAADCAADGQYDFFFSAPPLPFTRAVGSPVNPIAVK